jgi:REP element-mobilizing transposase RayT
MVAHPYIDEQPLGFFITWTVYGTFLQGDERGWRRRGKGQQLPQPKLNQWHQDRLNHPVLLLGSLARDCVAEAIRQHCLERGWQLWGCSCRSNHVHVVVTAKNYAGSTARDQLKASATRELRIQFKEFVDRPVWTRAGDWESLNSEEDIEAAVLYVTEAQDRMDLPKS